MTGGRRAVGVCGAAFALVLLGCGSITALDVADGGRASPPGATTPDAALISIRTADAGRIQDAATSPAGTKDAGPSTPPPATKDAGPSAPPPATKDAGDKGADAQSCATKNNCHGLVCNVSTGLCVECLVNSDCSGKTKLCDPTTLTCLACSSNGDCDGDKRCVTGACL